MNNSNSTDNRIQDNFKWTDELVKQFILAECNKHDTWSEDGIQPYLDDFKKAMQEDKSKRIEVKEFCIDRYLYMGKDTGHYSIHLSEPIPKEKYEGLKKAITDCLNGDSVYDLMQPIIDENHLLKLKLKKCENFVPIDSIKENLRQYPLTEQESIPTLDRQNMSPIDVIHAYNEEVNIFDRKELEKWNAENKPQDTLQQNFGMIIPKGVAKNPDGTDRKVKPEYLNENNIWMTKEKIDGMMENVWEAARSYVTNGLDTPNPRTFYKFKTFKDYHASLPENLDNNKINQ